MAFEQTGSLPYSISYDGFGYRYHKRSHFYSGQKFYRNFEDGPWKWEAQERYSPANIVCGHYLSCDPRGAEAEARFYNFRSVDRGLLELRIAGLDNVLDLTWEDNLEVVFKEIMETPPRQFLYMLRMLTHIDTGGNGVTDEIGWWAQSKGYAGIKYFSSRGIESHRHDFSNSGDRQGGWYIADIVFEELRSDLACQNLVLFCGFELIRRVSTYRFCRIKFIGWKRKNQFFGISEKDLDPLMRYGIEYRKEWLDPIFTGPAKPVYEVRWDGKVKTVYSDDDE